MAYRVQFVGLACFVKAPGERYVMFPDGRNPGDDIDPHHASIFVDAEAVESTDGWDQEAVARGEFPLGPCSITIDGVTEAGALDTVDHDDRLPQLCRLDPNFLIDRDQAETIATIEVRNGKLTGYRIPGGTAVISQLDVEHDGSIDIEVTPRDGTPVRSIRLRAGTEIALANTGRAYDGEAEDNGHFRIYEKLSARAVSLAAPPTMLSVPPSPSRHLLFLSRIPAGLSSDCSNTGCCDP